MTEVKAGQNGLPHGSIDVTAHESMGHGEGFCGTAERITFLVLWFRTAVRQQTDVEKMIEIF